MLTLETYTVMQGGEKEKRGKRVSFLGSFHTFEKSFFQMLGET